MNFYLFKDNKEHGPFTPSQLKKMAKAGGISVNDKIRKEDAKNYVLCGSVKGLFEVKALNKERESSKLFPVGNKELDSDDEETAEETSKWTKKRIIVWSTAGVFGFFIFSAILGNFLDKHPKQDVAIRAGENEKIAIPSVSEVIQAAPQVPVVPVVSGLPDLDDGSRIATIEKANVDLPDKSQVKRIPDNSGVSGLPNSGRNSKASKVAEPKAQVGTNTIEFPIGVLVKGNNQDDLIKNSRSIAGQGAVNRGRQLSADESCFMAATNYCSIATSTCNLKSNSNDFLLVSFVVGAKLKSKTQFEGSKTLYTVECEVDNLQIFKPDTPFAKEKKSNEVIVVEGYPDAKNFIINNFYGKNINKEIYYRSAYVNLAKVKKFISPQEKEIIEDMVNKIFLPSKISD